MDLASFKIRRPEFRNIPDDAIQACLNDAAVRTDASLFGNTYDEAHMWLAADILVSSPFGQQARLVPEGENKKSIYATKRKELEDISCGFGGGTL